MTCFTPRSCLTILGTILFGIPGSASSSHTVSRWSLWIAGVHAHHSQVFCLLQAFQKKDHFQEILNHLWSICAALLFALHPWHHPPKTSKSSKKFLQRIFKLNTKFGAYLLLSHFECDGHTVHMLTLWHLLTSLTSTVKLSLFTHAHSSPLSLAARVYWCCTNHSYINNGLTFSRQTLYL